MAASKYDEKVLAPLMVNPEWWYAMPLRTRMAIIDATGLEMDYLSGIRIGSVQERLAAADKGALRRTFMLAMQLGYDRRETFAAAGLIEDPATGGLGTPIHVRTQTLPAPEIDATGPPLTPGDLSQQQELGE